MRIILPLLSLAALAACQPSVPDDTAAGVGFGSYSEYQQQREAQLAQQRNQQMQSVQGPVQDGSIPYGTNAPAAGAPTASELMQAGIGQGQLTPSAPMTPNEPLTAMPPATSPAIPDMPPATPAIPQQPVLPQQPAAAAEPQSHAGISDEQDFAAVSSRESIESDKARMEQNKAQYQQVQPTELPERTGAAEAAVDLVQYALNAPNRKGETIYPRSRIALANSERACGRYDTPEAAQQAFMRSGGPQRDPKNLDPDGDGFACRWDPTPFQKARQ